MTEALINYAINLISSLGYLGVFVLMAAESMLIPIPVELVMTFSGFLASSGQFTLAPAIVVGVGGNFVGSTVAYFLGRHIGRQAIERLVHRYGKYFLVTDDEFRKVERILQTHGMWIIAACRFLPGLRAIISLVAGIFRTPPFQFLAITLVTSSVISTTFVLVGLNLGKNWGNIRPYLQKFDLLIITFIIILIAFYLMHKLKKQRAQEA